MIWFEIVALFFDIYAVHQGLPAVSQVLFVTKILAFIHPKSHVGACNMFYYLVGHTPTNEKRKTLMKFSFIKSASFALLALGLAACNPTLRNHGYLATEDKPQEVEALSDTKASVLARLGNPSIKSTFDEDVWFYMSSVRQRLAYLRPLTEERTITAITFNEDGQVQKVAEYGIENGQYINYVDRETPTRGRELSVLEQIFGTIGRLPTDQLGGDQDIPGGSGGPGGGR